MYMHVYTIYTYIYICTYVYFNLETEVINIIITILILIFTIRFLHMENRSEALAFDVQAYGGTCDSQWCQVMSTGEISEMGWTQMAQNSLTMVNHILVNIIIVEYDW